MAGQLIAAPRTQPTSPQISEFGLAQKIRGAPLPVNTARVEMVLVAQALLPVRISPKLCVGAKHPVLD